MRSTEPRRADDPPRRLPGREDFPERGENSLATVAQRAFARLIDTSLWLLPFLVVLDLVAQMHADENGQLPDDVFPLWLLAIALAVAALYEIVALTAFGATLGKWMVGLRVARYRDGRKPTFEQATLRCLVPTAAAAAGLGLVRQLTFAEVVVYLSAAFGELRRGWHDKAAGTVVICTSGPFAGVRSQPR